MALLRLTRIDANAAVCIQSALIGHLKLTFRLNPALLCRKYIMTAPHNFSAIVALPIESSEFFIRFARQPAGNFEKFQCRPEPPALAMVTSKSKLQLSASSCSMRNTLKTMASPSPTSTLLLPSYLFLTKLQTIAATLNSKINENCYYCIEVDCSMTTHTRNSFALVTIWTGRWYLPQDA